MGGSFDPVHNGHLALAEAAHSAGYDRVLLVPAYISPFKGRVSHGATPDDRLAMLRLAIADRAWLGIDDRELKRGGFSWTIDTLRALVEDYRGQVDGKLALVIGQDLVADFPRWHEAAAIPLYADILVAARPDFADAELAFPYRRVACEQLPISSTQIRLAIQALRAAGGVSDVSDVSGETAWVRLVPEPVSRYIVSHNLYEES
jgi:nicotinate-nucleotide adenylyltransferase